MGDRRVEVGIVQQDVGRLAAQFLVDALDRVGRGLRDEDAGAGRAREGHHVDVRMACDGLADSRAVAVDEVEDAGRHAGLVEDLREDESGERRDFAGLEHHGAAGRQSGADLAADLVQGPVPGRDQADDADGLAGDQGRVDRLIELIGLQDLDGAGDVAKACGTCRSRAKARGAPISVEMASARSSVRLR